MVVGSSHLYSTHGHDWHEGTMGTHTLGAGHGFAPSQDTNTQTPPLHAMPRGQVLCTFAFLSNGMTVSSQRYNAAAASGASIAMIVMLERGGVVW